MIHYLCDMEEQTIFVNQAGRSTPQTKATKGAGAGDVNVRFRRFASRRVTSPSSTPATNIER